MLRSGLHPEDRFTWFLEVVPFLVALPILIAITAQVTLARLHDRQIAAIAGPSAAA